MTSTGRIRQTDDSTGHNDLSRNVRSGVFKLRGLEDTDEVQIEILSQLADSRLTIAELVERVYGVTRWEEGFSSCYTRIRRAARRLESKGLVSTRLLGKEKPYRLTDLAVINLARIGGGGEQTSLMPRQDLAVYLATAILVIPIILLGAGWVTLSDPTVAAIFSCFFYLFGLATSRLLQSLRRVL